MSQHPTIEKVADSVILRLIARAAMALCVPLILAFLYWNTTTLVELRSSVASITTDLAWIQRIAMGTTQRIDRLEDRLERMTQ